MELDSETCDYSFSHQETNELVNIYEINEKIEKIVIAQSKTTWEIIKLSPPTDKLQ